ncbi:leucine-rich repeat domain-containing protein [Prevotella sp. E15-22]|uniref:leucine-rich repeat protein n=1 Tax=Prevotella sp. E15-22 TaxID=2937774 RepID=UPI002064AB20|nr:leucine-rich repeat protein [Prevotella sp. E15-22]UPS43948.1 leucine-rich repeat domain-containing protein [Prevotella sp. E15-22]
MRKFVCSLLLTVLLGIPLSTKATIVDDPGVFNFSPFYDPSSGVIGLSLTFFPSEEGDTVYIPDYIYENNQYKYVVNINTGAFYDCHAKYIRLPNHLRFIQDYAFHYCCFLTTLEFTNDISEIDFGEIDDIVGGCNYVDEIIVPLQYLSNYIDDPEDRFFPYYLYEQLKSKIVLSDYNKMIWADVNFKVSSSNNVRPFYCTGVSGTTAYRNFSVNVVPANTVVCLEGENNDVVYVTATTDNADNVTIPNSIHKVNSTTCVTNSLGNYYHYFVGYDYFTSINNNTTVCFAPKTAYLLSTTDSDIILQ